MRRHTASDAEAAFFAQAQDELVVAITRRIVETANRAQRALDDDAEPPTQPYYGAEPMQVVRYSQGQGYWCGTNEVINKRC